MAHAYHSPTTFCEVTYDSDWFEDDRHFTPYRYSLLRTDTDSNSDTVSLTLPSYTYYEYLRSLYDCRTTATPRHPPGYHVTSACSNGENPPRPATTWHAFGKDTNSELSRQAIRSEPTRIRPTYPFPSLHLIQQGESGEDFDDEIAVTDRAKKKLVWVDALNKWVPETQLHPRPYLSFVGNVPVVEKQGKPPKELGSGWEEISPSRLCDRFEVHMGRQKGRSVTPDRLSISNKQRNNDKREAVKKKAEEMAAQRRQRKAYSTPLYTTIAERKHKARVESSRVPHSTPVSPISQQHHQQQLQQQQQLAQLQQQRDRLPVPREVWQPEAKTTKDKSRTESKPSTPTRREISITLTTPKPEEHEQEKPLDESKEKGDRKVTFTEQMKNEKTEKKTKKKKEVAEDEVDFSSVNKTKEISQLEKDSANRTPSVRKSPQPKEAEAKEAERKLRDDREGTQDKTKELSKSPANQGKDQVYEATMNAAVLILSHEQSIEDQKVTEKPPKPVKVEKSIKSEKQAKNVCNASKSETKRLPVSRPESKKTSRSAAKLKSRDKNTVDTSSGKPKSINEPKTSAKDNADEIDKVANENKNVDIMNSVTEVKQAKTENVKIIEKVEVEEAKEVVEKGVRVLTQAKRRKVKTDNTKQKSKTKTDKSEKSKKGKKEHDKPEDLTSPSPVPTDNTTETMLSKDVAKTIPPANAPVKVPPKTKPMLVGMKQPQKPPAAMNPATVKSKKERLPITKPSEVELEPDPEPEPQPEPVIKPKSPHRERRKSIIEQRQHLIIKKERRERHCMKDEEEKVKKLPEIDIDVKKIDSWIFDKVDFTEETETDPSRTPSIEPLPSLSTDLSPEFIEKKKEVKEQRRKSVLAKLIQSDTKKLLRKPGKKDSSYQDELRRLELAEERRKKQMEMYERLKNKKMSTFGELSEDGTTRFDDYGFLSKYCIFTQGTVDVQMYKHAFDAVDEGGTGWLEGEDVMIALRGANNRLTEAEEEYLYRVLELTGYRITHGADFKMFSVLAGLSQKISALDKWMKNMIGSMDFKQLEMKIFKCKELWECNVDKDTNNITLDQLCVELRAGGVSFDHELEVREKLSHLNSLDLLDFLTYVPLFIMIHESVVANPLSDIRNK